MAKYSILVAGNPWENETEQKIADYLKDGLWIKGKAIIDELSHIDYL